MKETKPQKKEKSIRVPINTTIALASVCLSCFTLIMRQNGVQSPELFPHRMFTMEIGVATSFFALAKIWYADKYQFIHKNPDNTKKTIRQGVYEVLIGMTSAISQYFIY